MRFPSLYPRVWNISCFKNVCFSRNQSEIPYEVVGELSLKVFKMLKTQIRNFESQVGNAFVTDRPKTMAESRNASMLQDKMALQSRNRRGLPEA